MITKCQHCEKEFEAKRTSAKFCSNACKMAVKNAKVSVSVSVSSRVSKPTSVSKHLAGNPDNPIVGYYKELPITKEGFEKLKNDSFLQEIQDSYSASVLNELRLPIPKWKREFKTRQEAINACRNVLEKKYGMKKEAEVIDYSKWM